MPIGAQLTDFIATSTFAGDESDPSVAILADGRIAIVFQAPDADSFGIWVRILNPDGSAAEPDFRVNTDPQYSQIDPTVSALGGGGFVVSWTGYGVDGFPDIFANVFSAPGVPQGQFQVNTSGTEFLTYSDVTVMTNNRILVTWEYDDGFGGPGSVRGQYLNSDGSTFGTEFTVSPIDANRVSTTALTGGRAAITWYDLSQGGTYQIYMNLYDENGVQTNGPPIEVSAGSGAASSTNPSVTTLTNGTIAVAWADPAGGEVYYRVMSDTGAPISGLGQVANSSVAGTQDTPAVAALADGRFVIAFRTGDGTVDGDGAAIVARVFSADGIALGSDFVVNTTTANSPNYEIDVAAMPDGSFIVTWGSADGPFADDINVRARIFDPTVFIGTSAEDYWEGGSLDDKISGGANGDELRGNGGNDVINGGDGIDALYGDAGNDLIIGGTGADAAAGGAGRDEIHLGGENDEIIQVNDGDDAAGETYDLGIGSGDTLITIGFDGTYDIDLRDDALLGVEVLNTLGAASFGGLGGTGIARLTAAQILTIPTLSGDGDTVSSVSVVISMAGTSTFSLVPFTITDFDATVDRFVIEGDGDTETFTGALTVKNILLGAGGDDTITGGNLADEIVGGAGNDTMTGGDGDDAFRVLGPEDGIGETYDGGIGNDRILIADRNGFAPDGVTIDFRDDTLTGIEDIFFVDNSSVDSLATIKFTSTQIAALGPLNIWGSADSLDNDTVEITMNSPTLNLSTAGVLFGNFANPGDRIVILGTSSVEAITGSAQVDVITPGGNGDTLAGGNLGDIYNLAGFTATINENAGDTGKDRITSTIDRSLQSFANVEDLVLQGTAATGTGNGGDNTISGNGSNNTLNGLGGHDTLSGGNGNDTYVIDRTVDATNDLIIDLGNVSSAADMVLFTGSADTQGYTLGTNLEKLTLLGSFAINGVGNTLANTITGNSGNNVLNGMAGADTLIGGNGNDTYLINRVIDATDDTIQETGSSTADLVQFTASAAGQGYTLGGGIEKLTLLGSLATNGTGNNLANVITGNGGNNILDGKAGVDTLIGGEGNDTYIINRTLDSTNDVVQETGVAPNSVDVVQFTASLAGQVYNLTVAAKVEQLVLLGDLDSNGTGNALANRITGNAAANVLDGGTDSVADLLIGGLGNDTYVLGAGNDAVQEVGGTAGGIDTVTSTVTRSLAAAGLISVENLTLTLNGIANGTGNALGNILTGNGAANTLHGGAGNDTIIGGLGKDLLFGDTENDTFRFLAVGDSAVGANRDTIQDFDQFGNDVIDLTQINDVSAFIGGAAFSAAGQVRVSAAAGGVLVEINTVGAGVAESHIFLAGASLVAGNARFVDATDFLL